MDYILVEIERPLVPVQALRLGYLLAILSRYVVSFSLKVIDSALLFGLCLLS